MSDGAEIGRYKGEGEIIRQGEKRLEKNVEISKKQLIFLLTLYMKYFPLISTDTHTHTFYYLNKVEINKLLGIKLKKNIH